MNFSKTTYLMIVNDNYDEDYSYEFEDLTEAIEYFEEYINEQPTEETNFKIIKHTENDYMAYEDRVYDEILFECNLTNHSPLNEANMEIITNEINYNYKGALK